MRTLICLLLTGFLASQEAPRVPLPALDLRSELGADPAAGLCLAPRGCWDGLVLGIRSRHPSQVQIRSGQTTVEVWDLLPPSSPRQEGFALYATTLRERLSKAWLAPPPPHGAIELSEFMFTDPASPQKLDPTKVKSMQERFNRMPPNGSPAK